MADVRRTAASNRRRVLLFFRDSDPARCPTPCSRAPVQRSKTALKG